MADSSISHYEIIVWAVDRGEIMTMGTDTNATSFNVNGLLPQEGDINAKNIESDSLVFGVTRQSLTNVKLHDN